MNYGNIPDLEGVERILVVKLRHLGDLLLSSPVLSALRKRFPKAQIDVYIYAEGKEILEGHPGVDGWILCQRKRKKEGFWQRIQREISLLWGIRRTRYDLVLNLTEGDRGALAARVSGARIRVGVTPNGGWQKRSYTHLVKRGSGERHAVEKDLDCLRRIGIYPSLEERSLFFSTLESAKEKVEKRFGKGYLLIHPVSRWRFKCWPVDKMRRLIFALLEKGEKIVLSSGPDPIERQMVEAIGAGFSLPMSLGDLSIKEFGALIELSSLLVCVDSVPLHIASALKKKVVAIFGPTSEINWGPWNHPEAIVVSEPLPCRPCYLDGCGGSKYSDCLHRLSVSKVLDAITSENQSQNKFPAPVHFE